MNSKPQNGKAYLLTGVFAATLLTSAMGASAFSGPGFSESAVLVPKSALLEPQDSDTQLETTVLAGGCFWGMQAVFQHVKGVRSAVSGYSGGVVDTAQYERVSSGTTGHAEAVQITFDPKIVNYGTILRIYFSVAHDPTQLNRQGPDTGTQYRSAIFPESDEQKEVAEAYIQQLGNSGAFKKPLVTNVETGKIFYQAEAYHQDYATLHPDNGYVATFEVPKVEALSLLFPELYSPKPVLVGSTTSPS